MTTNLSNSEKLEKVIQASDFFKDPKVFCEFYDIISQNAAERFDYSINKDQKSKEFVEDFIIDFIEENVKPVSFEKASKGYYLDYIYLGCDHPMRSEFDGADLYYNLFDIEHAINNYDHGHE